MARTGNKKILITGGAGFIGSNIAAFLSHKGYRIVIMDNLTSGYKINLLPLKNAVFLQKDIRDRKNLAEAARGVSLIFHLAASVGNTRSIENPVYDSSTNILGTLNVLEAARANGVDRVVFSSSAGIFGELKTLPIREGHPQDPDSPYGVSKLAAEKLCLVYNKLYGMKNVCLRYFNVYGPHQRFDAYGNVIPIFAQRILEKKPLTIFGDGRQTRDFVNVRDVVAANVRAGGSKTARGVFNIGSGTRITINKLAERMIHYGSEVPIRHGPPRAGDVRHSLADIRKARKTFGFQPSITMENGLREYLEWFKKDFPNHYQKPRKIIA